MAIRHQFLLLIHILYCAAITYGALLDINDAETCNALCRQCNASAVFANGQCECNFTNNNNEGAECIQRIQKEIRAIDLNILSDDLTDEERSIRSILKSRRRLRTGDAEKVAQYFINGGPSAGHFHFVKASNASCDSTDSATNSFSVVDENNPESEFHGVRPSLPLNSLIAGSTYDSPLYIMPEAAPSILDSTLPDVMYTPILGMVDPILSYPMDELHDPSSPMLGSIIHPYGIHRHISPLHALLRTAAIPSHILHNLLTHRYSHRLPVHHRFIGRNAYPSQDSSSNALPNVVGQPCGNNDGSAASNDIPTARNNVDESAVERNVASSLGAGSADPVRSAQPPHTFNTLYHPMQYRLVSPYQYTSYQNPLLNVLYPPSNGYIVQVPYYMHSASDPMLTSTQDPNSDSMNNVNIERQSEVQTATDNTVHSNDEKAEKTDSKAIKNYTNVFKNEKRTGKDGNKKYK